MEVTLEAVQRILSLLKHGMVEWHEHKVSRIRVQNQRGEALELGIHYSTLCLILHVLQ